MKNSLATAAATCAREDPFAPPGFRLSRRLRLAAEHAGLDWADDIPANGSAFAATGEVPQLTIYSKTFHADVSFESEGNRTVVAFSNYIGGTEEAAKSVNADLERLLQEEKLDEVRPILLPFDPCGRIPTHQRHPEVICTLLTEVVICRAVWCFSL